MESTMYLLVAVAHGQSALSKLLSDDRAGALDSAIVAASYFGMFLIKAVIP